MTGRLAAPSLCTVARTTYGAAIAGVILTLARDILAHRSEG